MIELSRVVFRETELKSFTTSSRGAVGRDIGRRGDLLVTLARRSVGTRSRRLQRSINSRVLSDGLGAYALVGSPLSYALFNHDPTRPHVIVPRVRGRHLRFVSRGRVIHTSRVHHPGTRGTFFLTRHLPEVVK